MALVCDLSLTGLRDGTRALGPLTQSPNEILGFGQRARASEYVA